MIRLILGTYEPRTVEMIRTEKIRNVKNYMCSTPLSLSDPITFYFHSLTIYSQDTPLDISNKHRAIDAGSHPAVVIGESSAQLLKIINDLLKQQSS